MRDKQITILNNLLLKIEHYIPFKDKKSLSVSKSGVDWHLDHALKVITNVLPVLEKTNPDDYKNKISITGKVLLAIGWFPRGKVKAPSMVKPPELILEADIYSQLKSAKTHLKNISSVHKKAFYIHPIFGMLSKTQTLRFLEIHTKHHLKIVNDILRKQKALSETERAFKYSKKISS